MYNDFQLPCIHFIFTYSQSVEKGRRYKRYFLWLHTESPKVSDSGIILHESVCVAMESFRWILFFPFWVKPIAQVNGLGQCPLRGCNTLSHKNCLCWLHLLSSFFSFLSGLHGFYKLTESWFWYTELIMEFSLWKLGSIL